MRNYNLSLILETFIIGKELRGGGDGKVGGDMVEAEGGQD